MPSLLLVAALVLQPEEIRFGEGLGITVRGNARTPVRIDPVEAKLVDDPGYWPKQGETIDGQTWAKVGPATDGSYSGRPFSGGYAAFEVTSQSERPMLLDAVGNGLVYVNGEPRGGDVYSFGYVTLPVRLKKGTNRFLFVGGRGRLSARLVQPKTPVTLDMRDSTLPDVVIDGEPLFGAIVVRNCSNEWLRGARAVTSRAGVSAAEAPIPPIPPMSNRKVRITFPSPRAGKYTVAVTQGQKELCNGEIDLRGAKPGEAYKVTFESSIDGSVQYFAVNPPREPNKSALVLSLHGASVEALGQAQAYGQKDSTMIVCPTNRRPFGFDWEDIGRIDALEVLRLASSRYPVDPSRIYLTGHSMGGHGTWQIGAHFPDRFAAIAPSAGWVSFNSYAGGARYENPTPLEQILLRAMSPSDTLALKSNYSRLGVYIIHGTADDNVPFAQATQMKEALAPFHKDLQWHDQQGAGHWWDDSDKPGAACVDWQPMFDLFERRRLPLFEEPNTIDFATSNPGVSGRYFWLTVVQQERQFVTSRVSVTRDRGTGTLVGTTQNVAALTIAGRASGAAENATWTLDGQTISVKGRQDVRLVKRNGTWAEVGTFPMGEKTELRSGSFKSVFQDKVVFVYGTKGSPEENAWALAKARYDAETFWIRGNGSVDIVPDTEYVPSGFPRRNVVLYGNKKTNAAYPVLVESEFEVLDGKLVAGDSRSYSRPDLGVCAVFPHKGDQLATVAVVGGTGIRGMRLTDRVPVFTSGASMPDVLVYTPSALTKGTSGMLCAGFFGNDWTVRNGDFAWQTPD